MVGMALDIETSYGHKAIYFAGSTALKEVNIVMYFFSFVKWESTNDLGSNARININKYCTTN